MKRFYCFILFCTAMMFSIFSSTGVADNPVTVAFSYDQDVAYIGQPFTVNYEISGGSGEYTDIFFIAHSISEMWVIDIYQQEILNSKGSCTVIPECGKSIDFSIVCTDTVTNKKWEYGLEEIELKPNPDIPITLSNISEEYYIDKELSFTYSIDSIHPLAEATVSYWVFVEDGIYPDLLYEHEVTALNGSSSYTPKIGHALYIAIQGKDTAGRPFYAKTNRIKIEGSSSTSPVTIDFSYESKKTQIGQPFTVNYEISGGSGKYTDIFFIAHSISEMWAIDIYQQEILNSKGSCTVIPECGKSIDFSILCTDAVTNKKWECGLGEIELQPNPDIPIALSNIPEECYIDKELSFTYSIDSINPLAEATVSYWVFVEDDIYPDLLYEHKVSSLSGISSYIPKIGHSLYIAIQGKDIAGKPFYAKTDRIAIRDISKQGNIFASRTNFDNLSPVKVPTLILPDETIEEFDPTLKFDGPDKGNGSVKYNVCLVDGDGNKVDLPGECILCFPYPEGLNENSLNKYRIIIHHYADNGKTEVFKSEDGTIEFTKQGLCIRVSSFSPFEITWEEQPEVVLPQTGDHSHIALWLALLAMAGTAMLTLKSKAA